MAPDPRLHSALPLRLWYWRKVIGGLAGVLGPQLAGRAARCLGRGAFQFDSPAHRLMMANLGQAFPEAPVRERERIARAVFENVAAFWSDTLLARRRLTRTGWAAAIEVPERERWAGLRDRPALLVGGYAGNPVAAAVALSELLPPVHVVVDPASAWVAKRLWTRSFRSDGTCRRLPGLRLMATADAAVRLPQVMAGGERVLMLLGPKGRGLGGVTASFLGRQRRYSAAIGRLALRYGADIGVFACERVDGSAMRYRLELLEQLHEPGLPATARGVVQRVLGILEERVRQRPEQFLWTRW